MCIDKDSPPCEHGELTALVSRQQDQVARLTATVRELRKELAEARRAGKRQAAPFSKGGRTNRPKRPGRKPGIGSFSYRKPPSPDEVTEPPVDVSVADDNCPGCGGVLEQEGVDVAHVTDIPAMPRPQVTEYRVQVCRCRGCGRRVRGRHAEVGADQYGASAHGSIKTLVGNHAAVLLVCHMLSQSLLSVSTLSATTSSAQALFQLIPLRPFSLLLITMSTAFSTAPLPTGYPSDLSQSQAPIQSVLFETRGHISHQLPQTVGRVSVGQLHQLSESLFGSASDQQFHECVADRTHLLARYGRSDRPPYSVFDVPQVQDTQGVWKVFQVMLSCLSIALHPLSPTCLAAWSMPCLRA